MDWKIKSLIGRGEVFFPIPLEQNTQKKKSHYISQMVGAQVNKRRQFFLFLFASTRENQHAEKKKTNLMKFN
jgi:hypothetical protein